MFMSLGLACGSCFLIEKFVTPNAETEQTDDNETKAMTSGYWQDYATNARPYGSGTASDPYRIGSAQTLANFAFMVNKNYKNSDTGLLYQDACVELTADIDLSAHYWTPIGSGAYETTSGWWIFSSSTWHPYYFSGTFDGNGHTISGMYINASGAGGLTNEYVSGHSFDYGDEATNFNFSNSVTVGLFGFTKGATIQDLTVSNGSIVINSSGNSNQSLWAHVGAVVGLHAGGSISNTKNDGVSIGYYQYSDKATAAMSMNISGIAGMCVDSATIRNCSSKGNINVKFYGNNASFKELIVGGIVAITTYDVSYSICEMNILIQSQSSGSVASTGMSAGGIIGLLRSTKGYTWCYYNIFNGSITTDLGPGALINSVGGIIGNLLNISSNDSYKVYGCINYGRITIKNVYNTFVGGIVAVNQMRAIQIYKCINFADFSLTSNTSDNSTVIGYGGILGAGSNSGTYIYTCANYGDVKMTGSKAVYNIGGIAGFILDKGLVTNCINHGKIGTVGEKLGGIVGRTGQPKETSKFLFWDITTQDELSNVYITNCINYGPVTGGNWYGQIAGHMIGGTERVQNCYTRSSSSFNGASCTTWAIGNESSTAAQVGVCKEYNVLMSYTGAGIFAKSSNWTTDVLVGYKSIAFQSPNTSYGCYNPENTTFDWCTTSLVYNYYSQSQKKSKAMYTSSNYDIKLQHIIVPRFAVKGANASVYWDKRNNKDYEADSKGEVGTIEVLSYVKSKNTVDWVKSNYVYYLNGADYNDSSYSNRYENLLRVTYIDEKFTFTKGTYKVGSNAEVNMSYITNGKTYYARFKLFNASGLSFSYYFASKSVKSVNIKYLDSDNNNKAVTDGSIGTATVRSPNYSYYDISSSHPVYFKDLVYYTITPKLGYAFKSLSTDKGEIKTNYNEKSGFDDFGVVQGTMTYDFESNFNFYMKKITYNYNVFVDGSTINGQFKKGNALSFNVLSCVGYEYTIYLSKYSTSKNDVNLNKCAQITTTEATLGVRNDGSITLSDSAILKALSDMASKENVADITLSSFSLYVVKNKIEYTINIHNMINKYDQLDYYQEVTDKNYKTLIDSGMTSYDMTQFATFLVTSKNYLTIVTDVETGFTIDYTNAGSYGFEVGDRYSSFKTNTTLPSTSVFNCAINDTKATDIKGSNFISFLLNYKKDVKNASKTIDVYIYYQLGGYDLQGKAEKDGVEVNIPTNVFDLKGSSKQKNKNANDTTILYNNVFAAKYYAPITLNVNSLDSNQNFAGWYIRVQNSNNTLEDKLLSTNRLYSFVYNPQTAKAQMSNNKLVIVAKFLTYDESDGHTATNNKGIYQVSSAQDLIWLSERVNAGYTFEGMTIMQTCDINMSGIVFNSIGTGTNPFKGVYDGNNFIISNLNLAVNKNTGERFMNNLSNRGLFGYVKNATIKNLTVANGTVSGYGNVGMIAGYAENTKFNYVNTYKSNVKVSKIEYVDIYGKVVNTYLTSGASSTEEFSQRENVGGLVGYAKGCSFYVCSNRANIKETNVSGVENSAGFVGRLEDNGSVVSTINQCFNEGNISMGSSFDGFANWYKIEGGIKTKTELTENSNIKDCYSTYPSTTFINATYVDSRLDSNIWMTLNGRYTLRAFYWN